MDSQNLENDFSNVAEALVKDFSNAVEAYKSSQLKEYYDRTDTDEIIQSKEFRAFFALFLEIPISSPYVEESGLFAGEVHFDLDRLNLASWIITYSLNHSVRDAIHAFFTFWESRNFNIYTLGILNGIYVDSSVELANNIKLLNIEEIKDSYLRR